MESNCHTAHMKFINDTKNLKQIVGSLITMAILFFLNLNKRSGYAAINNDVVRLRPTL